MKKKATFFEELQYPIRSLKDVSNYHHTPMGLTIHLREKEWDEVFAEVKALTTPDVIQISQEDYYKGTKRFKFRDVIYEAVMPNDDGIGYQVAMSALR